MSVISEETSHYKAYYKDVICQSCTSDPPFAPVLWCDADSAVIICVSNRYFGQMALLSKETLCSDR